VKVAESVAGVKKVITSPLAADPQAASTAVVVTVTSAMTPTRRRRPGRFSTDSHLSRAASNR
jgi:hypothetical protein